MIYEILLVGNPFFDSYIHSDYLGKLIFIGLFVLSIISWVLILFKTWQTLRARHHSSAFREKFSKHKAHPLSLEGEQHHTPFGVIYSVLKKTSLDLLSKNQRYSKSQEYSYLSQADIEFVQAHLLTSVTGQTKFLENNLFILATVVTLAPFLGLLGTVWGILTTFSELQAQTGNTHQMVLSGLSLALATTVLGLVDAIPALIGYNYLKNAIRNFETDMESFAHEILASVELQYRKVDLG